VATARATTSEVGPELVTVAPLVSVVVPVYNCAPFLRESLDSILGQTYANLEVIVTDDASTDGSPAVAAEVARDDERVRVERQPANVGQFENVNAGLRLARGELVAVYHADDVYDPEIVAREVAYLQAHPEVAGVFALAIFIDGEGRELGRLAPPPPEIASADVLTYPLIVNALLRHTNRFLPTPAALVRRDALLEAGPYGSQYGLRGDLEMWLRLARRRPLGLLPDYLLRYRVGHDNETSRYGRLRTEPELFFTLMDDLVAGEDAGLVEPSALSAYEAHRAADLVLVAVARYAAGSPDVASLLRRVRLASLIRGERRLLLLWLALGALARLPRSELVAGVLRRRWQGPPRIRETP
jgi:glycosyltransferase involved in cell wall biosynthesis